MADHVSARTVASPASDWWLTANPSGRSADLTIKRIRRRRFGALSRQKCALERHLREGADGLMVVMSVLG
jgi:hypothetical protein